MPRITRLCGDRSRVTVSVHAASPREHRTIFQEFFNHISQTLNFHLLNIVLKYSLPERAKGVTVSSSKKSHPPPTYGTLKYFPLANISKNHDRVERSQPSEQIFFLHSF